MISDLCPWTLIEETDAESFILEMIKIGNPIEISLVGSFEKSGRGSRRDIELPLHRDGDYSTSYKDKIDVVGLYCIKSGEAKTLIQEEDGKIHKIKLKEKQALIFDNKSCRHGREGKVKNRLLLRVWVEMNKLN